MDGQRVVAVADRTWRRNCSCALVNKTRPYQKLLQEKKRMKESMFRATKEADRIKEEAELSRYESFTKSV